MGLALDPQKVKQQRGNADTRERPSGDAITTPVPIFTDAEPRHDLQTLNTLGIELNHTRPHTADSNAGPRRRRKPHLADLVLDSPQIIPNQPNKFPPQQHFQGRPSGASGIGLALGSPSQSPWSVNEAAESITSFSTRGPSPLGALAPSPAPLDENPRDRGRWKMFGGLFAKKPASNPTSPGTPFYQAQYLRSATVDVHPFTNHVPPKQQHRRVASQSLDHLPGVVASKPLPNTPSPTTDPPAVPRKQSLRRMPSLKRKISLRRGPLGISNEKARKPSLPHKELVPKPTIVVEQPMSASPEPNDLEAFPRVASAEDVAYLPRVRQPKLLELDIPNASMERYSIMFSDILTPRQSILARRHLPQLKVVDTLQNTLKDGSKPQVVLQTGVSTVYQLGVYHILTFFSARRPKS